MFKGLSDSWLYIWCYDVLYCPTYRGDPINQEGFLCAIDSAWQVHGTAQRGWELWPWNPQGVDRRHALHTSMAFNGTCSWFYHAQNIDECRIICLTRRHSILHIHIYIYTLQNGCTVSENAKLFAQEFRIGPYGNVAHMQQKSWDVLQGKS